MARKAKHFGCKVNNCSGSHRGRGFCNRHLLHIQRHGKLLEKTSREYRNAIILGNYAKLELGINGKNGYALIDISDSWLDKYKWNISSTGYAVSRIDGKLVFLHRLLMGNIAGKEVDHINRNRLDNRRHNLRVVTHLQNMNNLSLRKDSSSGIRGVYRWRDRKKWAAKIVVQGKQYHLGVFPTVEEAGNARNESELKLYNYLGI